MDTRIKKIADTYGLPIQSRKLMEECGELIQAMNKHFESDIEGDCMEMALMGVAEEIADVRIMCDQISYLLKIEGLTEDFRENKLNRTMKKVAPVMVKVINGIFGIEKGSRQKNRTWIAEGFDLFKGDVVEVENKNGTQNVLVTSVYELPEELAYKHKSVLRKVIY